MIIVIGGGPSGMMAAIELKKRGKDVILIERAERLGGVLPQCIHNGFGLHYFGLELTGPEFSEMLEEEVYKLGVDVWLNSMVLDVTREREVIISGEDGYKRLKPDAVVFAVGARERPRGALGIPGKRLAGEYVAGQAQYMTNIQGYKVGTSALIVGSGDIGLIMARRLTLEGIDVKAVIEIMPYAGGLSRNINQCLRDFNIPLITSYAVKAINGDNRIREVVVAKVDEKGEFIEGTEYTYKVDTVLFSVGLIPEVELLRGAEIPILESTRGPIVDQYYSTPIPGFYAVGNGAAIFDLVDNAVKSSMIMAKAIEKDYAPHGKFLPLLAGNGVRVIVPQRINLDYFDEPFTLYVRVGKPYVGAKVKLTSHGKTVFKRTYPALRPAEMVEIELTPSMFKGDEKEIVVEVEEGV